MAAYFVLIISERIVNLLSRNAVLAVGRFLGSLWYFLDFRRRHIAKRNVMLAFEESLDHGSVCRLARNSFRHMGEVFVDSLRLSTYARNPGSLEITIEGRDLVEEAFRKGKGLFFCIPHFGNWEMLVLLGKEFSRPLYDVARIIDNPLIERHVLRTRALAGMSFIDKNNAARKIIKCLKDNCGVGIFMDQNAGREGIYIDFFGRKASTYPTVASLAPRTGAEVLVIHSLMVPGGYRFTIEKPALLREGEAADDAVRENTGRVMRRFEEIIRAHPEQYFWVHQRWKPIQNELMRREFRRIETIVIKAPNWVGDVVMALPAISYVRKVFPEARIAVLIKEPLADLVQSLPDVDEVMTYRMRKGPARIIDEIRIIGRIRRRYFNLAVVLPYSVSSALWMQLAGVPMRLGAKVRGRGISLTHTVSPRRDDEHHSKYFLRMVRRLGTREIDIEPTVSVSDEQAASAGSVLADSGIAKDPPLVGIHPGAAYGPAKRWLPERFAGLATKLAENGVTVAVFSAGGERDIVDSIVAGTNGKVVNLCGKLSLGELAAAFKICDAVVTNDSGPMHLAGACGTKVVAIFGSTSPGATSPSGQCKIIWKGVDCSPCFRRECTKDFRCMTMIEVDEVFSTVEEMIRENKR